jgi:hypothetical protein
LFCLHEGLRANAKKAKAGSLARPRQVQLQLTIPLAYGLQELLRILTDIPRKGSVRFSAPPEMKGFRRIMRHSGDDFPSHALLA